MYFQLAFALRRVMALAPLHPEWKTQEPFASLLNVDMKGVLAGGERGADGIHHGDAHGRHRGIRDHRARLNRDCAASEDRTFL